MSTFTRTTEDGTTITVTVEGATVRRTIVTGLNRYEDRINLSATGRRRPERAARRILAATNV